MKKNPRDYKVNGKQFSFILDGIRNSSAISDGECQCKDDESLVCMFLSITKMSLIPPLTKDVSQMKLVVSENI